MARRKKLNVILKRKLTSEIVPEDFDDDVSDETDETEKKSR